jgi:uncharacterized damage-inducible protein DinB
MNATNASRLQRCETQFRDFLDEALRGISAEKVLEPAVSGKWSANENLAHLARYHEIFLERIERMLTGKESRLRPLPRGGRSRLGSMETTFTQRSGRQAGLVAREADHQTEILVRR